MCDQPRMISLVGACSSQARDGGLEVGIWDHCSGAIIDAIPSFS